MIEFVKSYSETVFLLKNYIKVKHFYEPCKAVYGFKFVSKQTFQIPDEEKHTREAATELYESYKEDDTPTNILQDNPIISALVDAFNSIREQLSKSETNMLWLQYVDMVDIFNTNLAAERTGNWKMYLKSIHMMLPFFAAAGRTNYTKSLYWFLQEMEENLDEELREAFEDGQFVARLTDNHWAGISPDRAIESTLMAGIYIYICDLTLHSFV